jgi:hypothetical protein
MVSADVWRAGRTKTSDVRLTLTGFASVAVAPLSWETLLPCSRSSLGDRRTYVYSHVIRIAKCDCAGK